MRQLPSRDEVDGRSLKRGCAIICVSIVVGLALTISVALLDEMTGLPIPRKLFPIALIVNGAIVAAGSAFGGWSSNEHVVDRVAFGLLAAIEGVVVYLAFAGCFGWIFREYI